MAVKIVDKTTRIEESLNRRKLKAQKMQAPERFKQQFLESLDSGVIPRVRFGEDFDLKTVIRTADLPEGAVAEFVSTGNFDKQWYERQRYEVEAGRDQEPILYNEMYAITVDASLPRMVKIFTLGPSGVVLEKITEGGEVQFASVGEGSKSVEIFRYAVGLEYSEDLFEYNELFRLANLERQFGVAHNALLNHLHFYPLLSYSYKAANQTDGTALTTFAKTASMPEKTLRAFEAAIQNAATDTSNPRRGPYVILCSTADLFTIERALNRVPQQGFDMQSTALGRIQAVIAYDGWTGTRGKKQTTYAGVNSGTAYLVDVSSRTIDFQSYVKTPLRMRMGEGDLKRFVMAHTVWDTRLGVFADPVRAVEEVTLPTSASGTT